MVIALTHIGFTENPASVEVDANVDTNLAAQVTGIDAIIGGHSHTDPGRPASGAYKYLPDDRRRRRTATRSLITQAYRYNNYAGRGRPRPARLTAAAATRSSARPAATSQSPRRSLKTPPSRPSSQPYHDPADRLQQHGHRPDHGADRHAAGLHAGDQRRQPAGGCLGL
ncbi:MAG: hypothetical protein MZV64_23900 [Ignavibacteriales bacterium]|nr:hypothetical protein [Ignavibacteriales bacterium]